MAQSIEHDSGPQNTWLRGQAGPGREPVCSRSARSRCAVRRRRCQRSLGQSVSSSSVGQPVAGCDLGTIGSGLVGRQW